jgi:hypothetical protein
VLPSLTVITKRPYGIIRRAVFFAASSISMSPLFG